MKTLENNLPRHFKRQSKFLLGVVLFFISPTIAFASGSDSTLSTEQVIRTILSLVAVCALATLLVPRFVRLRASSRTKGNSKLTENRIPKGMRIIERVDVSDQHSLVLVEIASGDRLLFSYDGESLELQTKLPPKAAESAQGAYDVANVTGAIDENRKATITRVK